MVCVAKDYLGADVVAQLVLVYGFDRTSCAYGHEYWGLYVAVVGVDYAGTGVAAGGVEVKGEWHGILLLRYCVGVWRDNQ